MYFSIETCSCLELCIDLMFIDDSVEP